MSPGDQKITNSRHVYPDSRHVPERRAAYLAASEATQREALAWLSSEQSAAGTFPAVSPVIAVAALAVALVVAIGSPVPWFILVVAIAILVGALAFFYAQVSAEQKSRRMAAFWLDVYTRIL